MLAVHPVIRERSIYLAVTFGCTTLLQLIAIGQTPLSRPLPTPSPEVLSQRRKALEVQVRQIEAEQDHPSKALQLRSLQEQLLQVTGEEDAVRQEVPESSKGLFGWTGFISVPVLYVTDRASKGNTFSGDLRDQGVEYGSSLVTLGTDSAERADMISGARNLPQRTHISPPTFQQLNGMPALLTFIKSNVTDHQGRTRRVLLFVHGYNASFNDALTATARISSEVQFPVIPVAYSWPSDGTYTGYWHDEDTVRASSQGFMKFLREFLKNSPSEVTIVCHSMGAREVTSALAEFGRRGEQFPTLHKVIFAAADISSKEFLDVWPDLQNLKGVQFCFYASNHDLALRLSHIVHGLTRLGPDVWSVA